MAYEPAGAFALISALLRELKTKGLLTPEEIAHIQMVASVKRQFHGRYAGWLHEPRGRQQGHR